MLDADLATLYGVETRVLNQAIKRNLDRFSVRLHVPALGQGFEELEITICDIQSRRKDGIAPRSFCITEHGAIMAASVLNSRRAVEISVYVVRAFVQLRETLATNRVLAAKLAELEEKTEALALRHDSLAANTRAQLRQVFDALRELMTPARTQAPADRIHCIGRKEARLIASEKSTLTRLLLTLYFRDWLQEPVSCQYVSVSGNQRLVADALGPCALLAQALSLSASYSW